MIITNLCPQSKKYVKGFFVIIISWVCLTACSTSHVKNSTEYLQWLNDEHNECCVTRVVNFMKVKVKYLPSQYLALKEYEASGKKLNYDSLVNYYQQSESFLVSFAPNDLEKGNDVMFDGISNYQEYVERVFTMNFDLESKFKLKTETEEYKPVLTSFENTYGLSKSRDVSIVFASKSKQQPLNASAYLDVSYNDEIYELGILHFVFNIKGIKKALPIIQSDKL